MGWARVDDGLDDHPKVLALLDHEQGGAALGLWTLCLTYAHRTTRKPGKTPGLIPSGLPRRYLGAQGRELGTLLVKVGLWHEAPDGWLIHDFVEYLPSDETRAARAEAGRLGAEKRWGSKAQAKSDDPEAAVTQPDGDVEAAGKQDDGNLPSSTHDVAGNAVATDGSRTRARRDPVPVPVPEPDPVQDQEQKTLAEEPPIPALVEQLPAPTPKKTTRRVTDDDPDFAAFWAAFPRKTAKGDARNAWAKAMKAEVDPALIIAAAEAFAAHCQRQRTEERFVPHPTTWLNGERWKDERPTTLAHASQQAGTDIAQRDGPRQSTAVQRAAAGLEIANRLRQQREDAE